MYRYSYRIRTIEKCPCCHNSDSDYHAWTQQYSDVFESKGDAGRVQNQIWDMIDDERFEVSNVVLEEAADPVWKPSDEWSV